MQVKVAQRHCCWNCGCAISTVDGRRWAAVAQWSLNRQLQLPLVGIGWCEIGSKGKQAKLSSL